MAAVTGPIEKPGLRAGLFYGASRFGRAGSLQPGARVCVSPFRKVWIPSSKGEVPGRAAQDT